jgi:hypothetical protein
MSVDSEDKKGYGHSFRQPNKPNTPAETFDFLSETLRDLANATQAYAREDIMSILERLVKDLKFMGGSNKILPGLTATDMDNGLSLVRNLQKLAHAKEQEVRDDAEEAIINFLGLETKLLFKKGERCLTVIVATSKDFEDEVTFASSEDAGGSGSGISNTPYKTPLKAFKTPRKSAIAGKDANNLFIEGNTLHQDDYQRAEESTFHQEDKETSVPKKAIVPIFGGKKGEVTEYRSRQSSTNLETFQWMGDTLIKYMLNNLQEGKSRESGASATRNRFFLMTQCVDKAKAEDPNAERLSTLDEVEKATIGTLASQDSSVPLGFAMALAIGGVGGFLEAVSHRMDRTGLMECWNGEKRMQVLKGLKEAIGGPPIAADNSKLESKEEKNRVKDEVELRIMACHRYALTIEQDLDETVSTSATMHAVVALAKHCCEVFCKPVRPLIPSAIVPGVAKKNQFSASAYTDGENDPSTAEWIEFSKTESGKPIFIKEGDNETQQALEKGEMRQIMTCGNGGSHCCLVMFDHGGRRQPTCKDKVCCVCAKLYHVGYKCWNATEQQKRDAAGPAIEVKPSFLTMLNTQIDDPRNSLNKRGRGINADSPDHHRNPHKADILKKGQTVTNKDYERLKKQHLALIKKMNLSNDQSNDSGEDEEQHKKGKKNTPHPRFSSIKVLLSRSMREDSAKERVVMPFTKETQVGYFHLKTMDGKRGPLISGCMDEGCQLFSIMNLAFYEAAEAAGCMGKLEVAEEVRLTNDSESDIGTMKEMANLTIILHCFSDSPKAEEPELTFKVALLRTDTSKEPHLTFGLVLKQENLLFQVGTTGLALRTPQGIGYMPMATSTETDSQLSDKRKKELEKWTMSRKGLMEDLKVSLGLMEELKVSC